MSFGLDATRFTISIVQLKPTPLTEYVPSLPAARQPVSVPRAFLDAMEVRREVFVKEQGVAAENEFDDDDPRSCHWVVYASLTQAIAPVMRDHERADVAKLPERDAQHFPVGTIRLIPFPHPPHPLPGGIYVDGSLVNSGVASERGFATTPGAQAAPPLCEAVQGQLCDTKEGTATDRVTGLHDGKEPYVKLGRLAVRKEFRQHKIGRLLVDTALAWMASNPTYFNSLIRPSNSKGLASGGARDIFRWNGLVCCHAQEAVIGAWQKLGFTLDEGMGRWLEEGIPHAGMFQRLDVGRTL